MKSSWGIFIISAAIFGSSLCYGKSTRDWTHFGVRPLAMGNAFVAVADDYNAMFYNPAGIARLDSWDGELVNPTFMFSSNFKSLIEDAGDLNTTNDTIDFIEKNTGEDQVFDFRLSPHLIFPGFGFGISIKAGVSAIFHREISVEVKSGAEAIVPFTYAKSLFDDKLSLGATLKLRVIGGVDSEFSMEDIEALSNNDDDPDSTGPTLEDYVKAGSGMGADFGLLFTPTKVMEPTIGISITDIGGTSFEVLDAGDEALGEPEVQLASVNVGLSLKPYMKNRKYVLVALDMHGINQPYSFSRKLNIGSEFGWGQFLKAQVGLYKGYPSFGLQLDAGIVNLKFLNYTEELGEVAGSNPSPRYAFQFKFLL